ncbi:MAG: hypothetical protein IK990_11985 [Ruminiclostridium sp.]|nr:hypothetical protein [Ruminiclostridium sp.]
MKKQRTLLKKIVSLLLLFTITINILSVNVYAQTDYIVRYYRDYTWKLPMYDPFTEEPAHNGGGYWASPWIGLRFALVDKNGDSLKTVDIFNMSGYSGIVQGVGSAAVIGTNLEILSGTATGVSGKAKYRIFNHSKVDVVNMSDSVLQSYSTNMIIANSSDYEDKRRKDSSYNWYCADYGTVFKNITINWKFDINEDTYDEEGRYFHGWAIPDAIDKFIYRNLTGKERTALTPQTLEEINDNRNVWVGMCDLLYALGLEVYSGVQVGNWNGFNLLKLYNNLISEFVIPEYCIIVEPVMFFCVPLFEPVFYKGKVIDYNHVRTSIYYGSVTELGLLESIGWIADEDDPLYSKLEYSESEDTTFDILNEGVYTRCFGQQCAHVTEEYAYDLEKCSMYGVLQVATLDDFINWKNDRHQYRDESYDFTAYTPYTIKNYAIGMSIITSSDFIKPQVETYDSEYRSDTNVVTSIKVSNRSDTNYSTMFDSSNITSNTSLNTNGVPKAMLCKFTVSKITDESGEVGRWTADRSDVTNQFKQKVEELGFAKDEEGEYITEFYGSLDGLLPREITNANAPCYVSFNWKTPKKPCKVTFEVEFLNANSNPEPVLGTDEHDGLRATEMDEDMRNIYGKYITYFNSDIVEGANSTLFTEDTVPPDSVSIISVSPNAAPGSDEQKLYDINKGIYDAYQVAHGTMPAVYTGTEFSDKTIIDSQSWSEYVASYDGGGNIVLTHNPHTVSIGLSKTTDDTYTDSTEKILRTDQSGLYSDYADTIGSGYGIGVDFISSFSNDEAGDDYIRNVTVNGVTYENSLVTNYDHGVVMFPEYSFQTYYGEILQFDTDVDLVGRSAERRFMLPANKDSKFYDDSIEKPAGMNDEEYAEYVEQNNSEKSRVHFTPVWYPDGTYQIVLCMFDAWTPAGQLWFYKTYNIEIKGSIYDTWYVTRTYKNQVTS